MAIPLKKNKAYVSSLIIEITRRCNMACEHCLRGNAQNLDITRPMPLVWRTSSVRGPCRTWGTRTGWRSSPSGRL